MWVLLVVMLYFELIWDVIKPIIIQYKNGKMLPETIRYEYHQRNSFLFTGNSSTKYVSSTDVVELVLEYLEENDDDSIIVDTYDIDMTLVVMIHYNSVLKQYFVIE